MLIRHDPFNRLDRMADELWRRMAAGPAAGSLHVHRDQDGVEITLDLPGVEPDGIEVTVERNLLTIRAERRARGRSALGGEVQRSETLTREVMLGDSLDSDGATARFEHGVLTIEVPARSDVHPRRLDISGSGGSTPIPTGGPADAGAPSSEPGDGSDAPSAMDTGLGRDAGSGADGSTSAATAEVVDVEAQATPAPTPTQEAPAAEPPAAKKSAAKKSTTKKAAAKKATPKKTAAKKSAPKKS